ncbi:MAG: Gfo/Idh/MocA family oxidoreductase [Myxococcota bacterium]|nr:Gfo/Idh/MocA family oxidoreductase [Myxococcota bacterium]
MIRVAVIGAGHMGTLHAEKVVALGLDGRAIELAGVCDIDAARAERLARKFGTHATTEVSSLLGMADAAIVAVPTVEHYQIVCRALERDCDVLVEKPITADLEQAENLIKRASERNRVLQVGHIEWFNAGIQAVQPRVHKPRLVEVVRVGPFAGRSTDTDVVRDLMIHDLDLVQQLIGEEPEKIEATGVAVLTDWIDVANARMTFPGGCTANFTASRVSRTSKRKLHIFQSDFSFEIDLSAQQASISHASSSDSARIDTEVIEAAPRDALLEQLRAFLACIEQAEAPPVGGLDGLGALRTALRVLDSMTTGGARSG